MSKPFCCVCRGASELIFSISGEVAVVEVNGRFDRFIFVTGPDLRF